MYDLMYADFENQPQLLLEVAQSGKAGRYIQTKLFGKSLSNKDPRVVKLRALKQIEALNEYKRNLEMLICVIDANDAAKEYEKAQRQIIKRITAFL